MITFQKTTTTAGNQATYGTDRLATWLEIDHGKGRRTATYATPGWIDGFARIREAVAKHGVKILPQHTSMFLDLTLSDAA